MPYITQKERNNLDVEIQQLSDKIANEGQLNYAIYCLCLEKMHDWKLNYKTLNKIMGVFECCKQEFWWKIVVPYERRKELENGSIE